MIRLIGEDINCLYAILIAVAHCSLFVKTAEDG